MAEVVGIKDLYANLKKKAVERQGQYSTIDVLVRLRDGIKSPHALNILSIYWWHLFLTNRDKYELLKTATDEESARGILGKDVVMTTYRPGEKTITVCSDLFPEDFFAIIDAYLAYTDELSRH